VDAKQALADLTEISSQVEAAVVFEDGGRVAGATVGDAGRAAELAQAAGRLLAAAEEVKTGESALTQLEVATGDGSVFIVRDGKTSIAATTGGNPTVGLVFYDLKSTLRALAAQPAATRTPAKKATTAAKKTTAATKKRTATTKKKTANRKPATRKKKPDAS
jgi:predicted regulator of Ras-like GTPase activity (Roadblock/LC7/MglB family)